MRKRFCKIWRKPYTEKRLSHYGSIEGEQPEIVKADGGRPAGWLKAERYIEKEVDMVSFNKVTRVIAGIAATALLIPMAACGGGSSSGGSAAPADIPAAGTDDGTEITLWTRSPLERQAKNAVKAYNASHKNQVKLEIIPNDDMEGKVGGASQTDSLPDILAGDVVRIPYWASEGIFTDITKQIDGLDNKSDLQQGHIEAGTVDGKEYTLPFITDVFRDGMEQESVQGSRS